MLGVLCRLGTASKKLLEGMGWDKGGGGGGEVKLALRDSIPRPQLSLW